MLLLYICRGLNALQSQQSPFAHQCCVRVPAGFALNTAAARAFCELRSRRKYAAQCAFTQETAARSLVTKAPRDSTCLGSVAARRAQIPRNAFSIAGNLILDNNYSNNYPNNYPNC